MTYVSARVGKTTAGQEDDWAMTGVQEDDREGGRAGRRKKEKKENPMATNRSHASSKPSTASELRLSMVVEWATAPTGHTSDGRGVALRADRG